MVIIIDEMNGAAKKVLREILVHAEDGRTIEIREDRYSSVVKLRRVTDG